MNETSPSALAHQNFAACYEQLRNDVLNKTSRGSVALVLLLRDGLAAWMRAFAGLPPSPARDIVPPIITTPSLNNVRSQASVILASLILNCRPEKSQCQPTCRK